MDAVYFGPKTILQILIQQSRQFFFAGVAAHVLFAHLAIFEDEQSGNAAHAITWRSDAVAVHIHLVDLGLAYEIIGQVFDHWSDGPAGSAPHGPEIHQHGNI